MGLSGIAPVVGARVADAALEALPEIELGSRSITELFRSGLGEVERTLPGYLPGQRWFSGKEHAIEGATVRGLTPIKDDLATRGHLAMVDVRYADGAAPQLYAHAMTAVPRATVRDASELLGPMARVHAAEGEFVLTDAMGDRSFVDAFTDMMRGNKFQMSERGETVAGTSATPLHDVLPREGRGLALDVLPQHSSNTNVKVTATNDASAMLKLVRLHDAELVPGTPTGALDVWKGEHLTRVGFEATPNVLGSIDHYGSEGLPRTVATLTEFAPNEGDTWTHALEQVDGVLGAARTSGAESREVRMGIRQYAKAARNHGVRLGQMHTAFASGGEGSEFRAVRPDMWRSGEQFDTLRGSAASAMAKLRASGMPLPSGRTVDELETALGQRIDDIAARGERSEPAFLIHTHGDYHLGQMLKVGDDVKIVDLEGAPSAPIAERWERTDALTDVARQRSSYEYAGAQGLAALGERGASAAELDALRPVAERFSTSARDAFMEGYGEATQGQRFVPSARDMPAALDLQDLTNAVYETGYELGSRGPDWARIP
ncbi:MAG: trehalose synthase, partial [Thermoleophilia bacterium]|nr:trehalose synthase [Thermoleophilia bacterium]